VKSTHLAALIRGIGAAVFLLFAYAPLRQSPRGTFSESQIGSEIRAPATPMPTPTWARHWHLAACLMKLSRSLMKLYVWIRSTAMLWQTAPPSQNGPAAAVSGHVAA
jgi:hypothetical protein